MSVEIISVSSVSVQKANKNAEGQKSQPLLWDSLGYCVQEDQGWVSHVSTEGRLSRIKQGARISKVGKRLIMLQLSTEKRIWV